MNVEICSWQNGLPKVEDPDAFKKHLKDEQTSH